MFNNDRRSGSAGSVALRKRLSLCPGGARSVFAEKMGRLSVVFEGRGIMGGRLGMDLG